MMKSLLLACCLLFTGLAQAASADPALTARVNAFLDGWHDDAAHTRMAYFDKMAPDGVYIGTDRSEHWDRDAFREWARPMFARKKGWEFHATRRHVYASKDGALIWFDELLDTQMGHCMSSGVLRKTATGFEIVHYQLSMAVPNEIGAEVTALVKQAETKAKAR